MPFIAAVTQPSWIQALRQFEHGGEVNFWRPGKARILPRHFGLPLVFVEKGKEPRRVSGYGIIDRFEFHSVSEAWDIWRERNGVEGYAQLKSKLRHVAETSSTNDGGNHLQGMEYSDDTVIGCVVLRDVVLLPLDKTVKTTQVFIGKYGIPLGLPKNVVTYMRFEVELPDILRTAPASPAPASPGPSIYDKIPEKGLISEGSAMQDHALDMCLFLFTAGRTLDGASLASEAVTPSSEGYSLAVTQGTETLHVDVKGIKLRDRKVRLSMAELEIASADANARLFVVSGITTVNRDGRWYALGGIPVLYRWRSQETIGSVVESLREACGHGLTPATLDWEINLETSNLVEEVSAW